MASFGSNKVPSTPKYKRAPTISIK